MATPPSGPLLLHLKHCGPWRAKPLSSQGVVEIPNEFGITDIRQQIIGKRLVVFGRLILSNSDKTPKGGLADGPDNGRLCYWGQYSA